MCKNFLSSLIFMIVMSLFMTTGCKRDKPEDPLRISTNASLLTIALAPDFSFNLKVESAMPEGGVRIDYKVTGELDNQVYPQGPAITTSNNTMPVNLTNLPRQKFCICTITVTSNSRSSNVATTNFRIVYK